MSHRMHLLDDLQIQLISSIIFPMFKSFHWSIMFQMSRWYISIFDGLVHFHQIHFAIMIISVAVACKEEKGSVTWWGHTWVITPCVPPDPTPPYLAERYTYPPPFSLLFQSIPPFSLFLQSIPPFSLFFQSIPPFSLFFQSIPHFFSFLSISTSFFSFLAIFTSFLSFPLSSPEDKYKDRTCSCQPQPTISYIHVIPPFCLLLHFYFL